MQHENFNKNQKHAEAKDHVIVGREIYINLFSPGIFYKDEDKNKDKDKNVFDTDENKNLIFQDSVKNIYSEEIKRTASELYNMLDKKNQNASAETIRKLYEAFAKFRYACACYLTGQKDDGDIYNYFKYDPWTSNKKIRDLKSQIYKTEKDLDADLNMFLNKIIKSFCFFNSKFFL